jgi:hypothetical protein
VILDELERSNAGGRSSSMVSVAARDYWISMAAGDLGDPDASGSSASAMIPTFERLLDLVGGVDGIARRRSGSVDQLGR